MDHWSLRIGDLFCAYISFLVLSVFISSSWIKPRSKKCFSFAFVSSEFSRIWLYPQDTLLGIVHSLDQFNVELSSESYWRGPRSQVDRCGADDACVWRRDNSAEQEHWLESQAKRSAMEHGHYMDEWPICARHKPALRFFRSQILCGLYQSPFDEALNWGPHMCIYIHL